MRAVVVHRGGRDHYQVARALAESDTLDTLVTDLYWRAGPWARAFERMAPTLVGRALRARREPAVDDRRVRTCGASGAISQLAAMLPGVPFAIQRRLIRWSDHSLGRKAQRLARRHGAAMVSYSYYAHAAFRRAPANLPRILFQLHPHPASVREILLRELERYPECRTSLMKEWELSLPEADYKRLVEEVGAAHSWIVASSFTRQTLIDHGTPADRIVVSPYGVDLAWFTPGDERRESSDVLRVLFVGTINQRKGIRYLLEALDRLNTRRIHLTVCGRVVDDLSIFRSHRAVVDVRPNVSAEELRQQYRAADVFVLPSLAEGFGHVILEALACGAPVITTTRSAGPDLIRDGREGFVIPPADSAALEEALQWCLDHPRDLAAMRPAARARAETFTWPAFRARIGAVVSQFVEHQRPGVTR